MTEGLLFIDDGGKKISFGLPSNRCFAESRHEGILVIGDDPKLFTAASNMSDNVIKLESFIKFFWNRYNLKGNL